MIVVDSEAPAVERLTQLDWGQRATDHANRADALTAAHRERRQHGRSHPVEDFLWTYYSVKPGELRRWHPGAGVTLAGAAADRGSWRHYRTVEETDVTIDLATYFERRGATVDYVEELLTATLAHPPRFGCFGLHELAMVYQMTPEQLRHSQLPLRIGHDQTDQVVEAHPISCTHFDAYRFFTPAAEPLNEAPLTREGQRSIEQSGCLHAGMDVYKWAAKLGPIIPGDLLLDAFVLASDIRVVDMRASPYDVSSLDLAAIPIETVAGKREYARHQRGFSERGNALRIRVLSAIDRSRKSLAAA